MSNLKQSIEAKRDTARKEKNAELLNVFNGILAKVTEAEKNNSNTPSTDEDILKVIEKLSKQREESIIAFKNGNREDKAKAEEFELNILKEFLPQKMDEASTRKVVEEAVSAGANNIGLLMKELNKYGNLIDKKLASQIAKELIS